MEQAKLFCLLCFCIALVLCGSSRALDASQKNQDQRVLGSIVVALQSTVGCLFHREL